MNATRSEHRVDPAVEPRARVRGGISPWSIVTGLLVTYGAILVLSALFGSMYAAMGVTEGGLTAAQAEAAAWGTVAGLFLIQFLGYMWGGYTAGRMARGSGWVNGILVAVAAVVLVMILGAIVAATAAVPVEQVFPVPLGDVGLIATGAGIALLVAALGGGALGGTLGSGWHTKLEDSALASRRTV